MSQFKDDIRLRLSGSWQSTVEIAGSLGPQRGLDHYQLVRKTYSHLLRMEEDGEVVSTIRSDEDGCRMRYWRLQRCCRRSRSTSSMDAAAWRVSTSPTWATRGTPSRAPSRPSSTWSRARPSSDAPSRSTIRPWTGSSPQAWSRSSSSGSRRRTDGRILDPRDDLRRIGDGMARRSLRRPPRSDVPLSRPAEGLRPLWAQGILHPEMRASFGPGSALDLHGARRGGDGPMPVNMEDFENHLYIARQFIFEAEKHLKEAVNALDTTSLQDMFRAGCIAEDMVLLTKIDNSLGEWRDERCPRPLGPTASSRSTASSRT